MAAPRTIGRYRVERLLGTGSFATVWLAYDAGLDGRVAIKILAENWSLDDDIKRRFLEEARILWRAQHDRIVRVHVVEQLDDGRPYFVMDYADGGTLHDELRERLSRGDPFTVAEAVGRAREIAECLAVAHDLGIVHRDLKPSNILFQSNPGRRSQSTAGPDRRLVLADFGLARRLESVVHRTVIAGTPAYMAPEQGDPEHAARADERSDIFSANAILYELLAGRPPFPGQSIDSVRNAQRWEEMQPLETLRPDVPPMLGEVVIRGLAFHPADRFASALEWSDALTAALTRAGSVIAVDAPSDPESPTARVERATGRLIARLGESPVIGAVEQARECLDQSPEIAVAGTPEPLAGALAEQLAARLDARTTAAGSLGDADTTELPETSADALVLLLPDDPIGARPTVAAAQRAAAAREDSPFIAIGLVLASPGSDPAVAHRADEELRSVLLTTFTIAWPFVDEPHGREPYAMEQLLAQAYGGEPSALDALSISELRDVLDHLVLRKTDLLRAEAAIGLLRRGVTTHTGDPAASDLADAVERLELSIPGLAELAVLRSDLSGHLQVGPDLRSDLRRVLLERTSPARLGQPPDAHPAELSYSALEAAERWRAVATRLPYAVRESALIVARRYDAIWEAAEQASMGI